MFCDYDTDSATFITLSLVILSVLQVSSSLDGGWSEPGGTEYILAVACGESQELQWSKRKGSAVRDLHDTIKVQPWNANAIYIRL